MRERTMHDAIERRYYARHRDMYLADDLTARVSVLTTRYTYEIASRPCLGPRGGKNHSQLFYRSVYYYDGRFYRNCNLEVADYSDFEDNGKVYENALCPISGRIWDTVPIQSTEKGIPSVSIICENGFPVSVEDHGTVIWDGDSPWSDVAHLLALDKKKRRSPNTKQKTLICA